jgi:hypothetical protein
MRRERELLPCVRKFLCQAVQSSGFLKASKGPKLTKKKEVWSFGAGLFVYFWK